jgi:transposase-like protein
MRSGPVYLLLPTYEAKPLSAAWRAAKSSKAGSGDFLALADTKNKIKTKALKAFIAAKLADETSAIMTDDFPAYDGCGDHNTRHETVNHSAKEWVRGDVHTNTMENVWSLFKRSIIGSYHQISVKHLDRYLDELEFRFNNRNNPYLFRDTLL